MTPPAPHQDASDESLLHDREEPGASFAAFYRRHVDAILRLAARRGLDPFDAADLTSETFAAALLARHRYRPDAPAIAWLTTIAQRKLIDRGRTLQRRDRARRRLAMDRVVPNERDIDEFDQMVKDLAPPIASEALATLPDAHRNAIKARVIDGQSYDDIASALGVSPQTARQHVSRGLATLRDSLKEDQS